MINDLMCEHGLELRHCPLHPYGGKMTQPDSDPKTYQSPVTGETIRVYPTEDDWANLLRDEGRTGPHWESQDNGGR